jgi:glycosyltransferase involved in cell wall biosynthesis
MAELQGVRVLYISYNGVTEPLVHSQVLGYLRGLGAAGVRYHLLTFEKVPPADEERIRETLAAADITWSWLPYSGKRGLIGSFGDVLRGRRFILGLRNQIDFVHCRSFFPSAMAWAAGLFRKVPFLYDSRGFWALEKSYKGRITSRAMFSVLHRFEMHLFRRAKMMISLTDAGARWVRSRVFGGRDTTPIVVIPTCVDLARFERERVPLNASSPVVVYSGSLGEGYLREEVFRFFKIFQERNPGAKLCVLTRSEPELVRITAETVGVPDDAYTYHCLSPDDVPAMLLKCDLALSFIKPHVSKIASCPTKMAEYLAAGLPVVANGSIGDVGEQLRRTNVGAVMDDFDEAAMVQAAEQAETLLADPEIIHRARAAASADFSLGGGVAEYKKAYAGMLNGI